MSFLAKLKGSYIVVLIAVIFSNVMYYLTYTHEDKSDMKVGHIKLTLLIVLVTSSIVYINNSKKVIEEEIFSGSPPF